MCPYIHVFMKIFITVLSFHAWWVVFSHLSIALLSKNNLAHLGLGNYLGSIICGT